jgi:hypothetical protein
MPRYYANKYLSQSESIILELSNVDDFTIIYSKNSIINQTRDCYYRYSAIILGTEKNEDDAITSILGYLELNNWVVSKELPSAPYRAISKTNNLQISIQPCGGMNACNTIDELGMHEIEGKGFLHRSLVTIYVIFEVPDKCSQN